MYTQDYSISYKRKTTKKVVKAIPCPMCKGKGASVINVYDGLEFVKTLREDCNYCKGKGKVKRSVAVSNI